MQIASIGSSEGVGPEMGDGRARIRNAQLEAMAIKNTGMAVTIDIGAVKEHPVNKYDVGLRIARWAMRNQYGVNDMVPSGSIYKLENGLMLGVKEGYEPVKPNPGASDALGIGDERLSAALCIAFSRQNISAHRARASWMRPRSLMSLPRILTADDLVLVPGLGEQLQDGIGAVDRRNRPSRPGSHLCRIVLEGRLGDLQSLIV